MLYRNRVGDPKNICVLCGLKDCVRSFTLWCKRHQSASQELYSHSEAAGENAEDLWRRNVEKEACYICGTKDCLRSFADIKKQAHWDGRGLEVRVIKSKAIHYLQKHKSKTLYNKHNGQW